MKKFIYECQRVAALDKIWGIPVGNPSYRRAKRDVVRNALEYRYNV